MNSCSLETKILENNHQEDRRVHTRTTLAGMAPSALLEGASVAARVVSRRAASARPGSRLARPLPTFSAARRVGASAASRRFETSASVPADPTTADLEAIEAAVEVTGEGRSGDHTQTLLAMGGQQPGKHLVIPAGRLHAPRLPRRQCDEGLVVHAGEHGTPCRDPPGGREKGGNIPLLVRRGDEKRPSP